MNCPRCQEQLFISHINDCKTSIEIDTCPNCKGIWFDKNELSQIDDIIEPTFIEIRHIPNKDVQMETLHCPSCNNSPRLQKAIHPRDSKVIIDYCPYCHGIWLDKGELEAIQKETWIVTLGKIAKRLVLASR
ncbi:TFIIB-type zinc ribbon-containing protein [Carboxylicivirga marina]|uniref:Zf-TFIIB domain-containing protein n=1 Tax=Carboxylicivirga marina TaxID=2800988 RepID=A0ABS1HJG5_9BACT|nr:zf-TFIIB domain-containing protein [Carboxylicivirga marina]MBK3517605.1 zf-TFIIB domain-containing protein [Carboxylicivirga marina]